MSEQEMCVNCGDPANHCLCNRQAAIIRDLRVDLAAAIKDRDHWKANHDHQVSVKQSILDRPDLQDRAKKVQDIIAERDAALARVVELEKAARPPVGYLRLCCGTDCKIDGCGWPDPNRPDRFILGFINPLCNELGKGDQPPRPTAPPGSGPGTAGPAPAPPGPRPSATRPHPPGPPASADPPPRAGGAGPAPPPG